MAELDDNENKFNEEEEQNGENEEDRFQEKSPLEKIDSNMSEEDNIVNSGEGKDKDQINKDKILFNNIKEINLNQNESVKKQGSKVNKMNQNIKSAKKKSYDKGDMMEEEKKDGNDEHISTEELFKKARLRPRITINLDEYDKEGNTVSTKITEALYDKFVGQNVDKSKHFDIYSKIQDEEIKQGRESTRTKEDLQKINNMIVRQEDYEKLKSDKKKGRQKEKKNKINEECVFNPNGKRNSTRSYNDFYIDQKKFVLKKEECMHKLAQEAMSNEVKNIKVVLTSKNSEKIASTKNPHESQAEFFKRLAEEKLKINKREKDAPAPKEEKKKNEIDIKNLTEKLHKEGEKFKINREKKEKERIDDIKKLEKGDFVLQKSKKVLLDKFISSYHKVLQDLFDKKDNFQIDYEQYKNLLKNIGFINEEGASNENLIKESFNKYLKPVDNKIDTYAFLVFGLTALGIYKGKDEKVEEHSSKVSMIKKE